MLGHTGDFFGCPSWWGVLMAVKCIGHPGTGIIPLKVPVRPPQCRLFYFEGQGKLPVEAKLEEQVGQT